MVKRVNGFPFRQTQGKYIYGLTTPSPHFIGRYGQWNTARKRNHRRTDWKKRNTTVSIAYIIVYGDNLKEPDERHRSNEVIQVSGHKVNIEKSILFLWTSNKQLITEIFLMIPFTIAPPQNEILKYKANKTCTWPVCFTKTLMKEIKDLNKWRDIPHLWTGTLHIIKL